MAFPYGWGRKCPITIDHTKVVGVPGEYQLCLTESNLPLEMLDALNANCANVDGSDIRVTSDAAGTTELARQVAYFDQSSGKASIIVKLPSISSAIDDVVWVWYNNASALEPDPTNANGQYSVYGSEFVGVYPLLKDANDSTLNQLNLLVTGSAVLAAGNGYDFNGGVLYHSDDPAGLLDPTPNMTVLAIATPTTTANEPVAHSKGAEGDWNYHHVLSIYGGKWNLGYWTGAWYRCTSPDSVVTGTKYAVGATKSSTQGKIFVDGVLKNQASLGAALPDTAAPMGIGGSWHTSSYGWYSGRKYYGRLAFMMYLNVEKSEDWVNTWTTNYGDPASFASAGSPQNTGLVQNQTELVDVRLHLSAYYQGLEDLRLFLMASDGTAWEDLKLRLQAAGWTTEDLTLLMTIALQSLDDMPLYLSVIGQQLRDLQLHMAAYGRCIEDLRLQLIAAGATKKDLKLLLSAVSSTVLADLVLYLSAADGWAMNDLKLRLSAVRKVPAFQSVLAQRLSSIMNEVV